MEQRDGYSQKENVSEQHLNDNHLPSMNHFSFVDCDNDQKMKYEVPVEGPSSCCMDSNIVLFHCSPCDIKFENYEELNRHLSAHRVRLKFSCRRCGRSYTFKCDLVNHMLVHIKDIFADFALKNKTSPEVKIEKVDMTEYRMDVSDVKIEDAEVKEENVDGTPKAEENNKSDNVSVANLSDRDLSDDFEHCYAPVNDNELKVENKPIVVPVETPNVNEKEGKKKRKYVRTKALAPRTKRTKDDNTTVKGENKERKKYVRRKPLTVNPKETFECEQCKYSTDRKYKLMNHLVVHSSERPFACHLCEFTSKWRRDLTRHILKHTTEKLHQCDKCEFRTQLLPDLRAHKLKHSESTFVCEVCGRGFYRLGALVDHRKVHSDEKPYSCPYCPYRCKKTNALKTHVGGHTREKMYRCEQCDFQTPRDDYIRKHKKTHSKVDPHQCKSCSFTCKAYATLKRHRLIHTGVEVFSCTECDYKSVSDGAFKRHLRVHRESEQHNRAA